MMQLIVPFLCFCSELSCNHNLFSFSKHHCWWRFEVTSLWSDSWTLGHSEKSHVIFNYPFLIGFLEVKPASQYSIMMDVLASLASIAFSLFLNQFNSFVQDRGYHLISTLHIHQWMLKGSDNTS